jgi:hypothetical protein
VFRSIGKPAKSLYRPREAAPFAMNPAWTAKLDASARKTLRQRLAGPASPIGALRERP